MQRAEAENLTRFDGTRSGFYEVYFIEVQDEACDTGLWIRYTIRSPTSGAADAVAEVWGMFFDRKDRTKSTAIKRTIPWSSAQVGRDRFSFVAGESSLTHSGAKGLLVEGERRIEWDLHWGEDRLLVHYPSPKLYDGGWPKTKVVSPHANLRASGSYAVNGRTWTLKDAPGQQSHLWGTRHAHRWRWCHANTFAEDPTAVFEGLTAQVAVGPVKAPPLTLYFLTYKGTEYAFNGPLDMLHRNESRTDAEEKSELYYPVAKWIVGGGNDEIRFRGEIEGAVEQYLGVRYKDPDGTGLVCCHNKLSNATLEILRPDGSGGWRVADTLHATSSVALEFVGRQPDPRVPVLI